MHPNLKELIIKDSDGVKWFKENWGLDDDSGWIKWWKDMEVIFADTSEESEQDHTVSSLCRQEPELDLQWKYCGFYTGLDRKENEETQPKASLEDGSLFEYDVDAGGSMHFTVVDIQNTDKSKIVEDVTIKFFFDYAPEDKEESAAEEQAAEDAKVESTNPLLQLFEKLTMAVDVEKRAEKRSPKLLSFYPHVTNVTSGDDFSKRYFWEHSDVNMQEEDPALCPEGKPKVKENCRSMEITVP